MRPSKARAGEVERTPARNDKPRERLLGTILVTCNMNAKGQTWNEDVLTVTRPKEKSPS